MDKNTTILQIKVDNSTIDKRFNVFSIGDRVKYEDSSKYQFEDEIEGFKIHQTKDGIVYLKVRLKFKKMPINTWQLIENLTSKTAHRELISHMRRNHYNTGDVGDEFG